MPLIKESQEWYEDIIPLTDGIVTYYPPEISAPGAAPDLDWWYEVKRELRKVPGRLGRYTAAGAGAVRGIYFWPRKNTDDLLIMHTTDRVFSTPDLVTFTQRATGLIGTKRDIVSYAAVTLPAVDRVLWTDHKDVPKSFDGTTVANLALPTGVTNARLVKFFKTRTLLIDVTESAVRESQRIWYSEAFQYNLWDPLNGAGTIDYTEGGGKIVTAVEFNDTICLFKEFRLATLNHSGDALLPFRLQDFPESPGTLFPNSPAVSPRGVLYLAYDGIRLFDGQRSVLVSGQAGFDIAAVAADQRNAVFGIWDQRLQRYLIALPTPGASDNDRLWEFHFTTPEAQIIHQGQLYKRSIDSASLGFFFRRTPLSFTTLSVTFNQVPGGFDDPALAGSFPTLVTGDYSGHLFELEFTTDDNGAAKTATIDLGPYPKDPVITSQMGKRLTEIRIRGRQVANTAFTVQVRPIHSDTWITLPRTVDMGSTYKDRATYVIPADGIEGEQFFIRFRDADQYSWPRIYSMTLHGHHSGAFRRP